MKKFLVILFLCMTPCLAKTEIYVTYFHTSNRFDTCKRLEAWTKDAVRGMDNVKFNSIDMQKAENFHYIPYFNLTSKVVVISDDKGHYKQLDESWNYAKDVKEQNEFINYVRNNIRSFKRTVIARYP